METRIKCVIILFKSSIYFLHHIHINLDTYLHNSAVELCLKPLNLIIDYSNQTE